MQKSATLGNDVKLSGERSFDQDGSIVDYYWQIKQVASNHNARQAALDENDKELLDSYISQSDETKATKDDYRYDTGRDYYGLDSKPSENLEKWKKGEIYRRISRSSNFAIMILDFQKARSSNFAIVEFRDHLLYELCMNDTTRWREAFRVTVAAAAFGAQGAPPQAVLKGLTPWALNRWE